MGLSKLESCRVLNFNMIRVAFIEVDTNYNVVYRGLVRVQF